MFAFGAALALVAAADPATETSHVVGKGETLTGIAERAGVPAAVIAAANGIAEPYAVQEGQRLAIPRQRRHVVKAGESALGIAKRYDLTLEQLAVANGIAKPYAVKAGQALIIPARMTDLAPLAPVSDKPYFRKPHEGRVLLGFARRPDGGGHEGIDIAVKPGDMVRASASGKVVFAALDSGRFGRLVVIDHGGGWRTRYGHLTRITVALGDTVRAGERVGIAGQAGEATRPELHFDILKYNRPVDPAKLLAHD